MPLRSDLVIRPCRDGWHWSAALGMMLSLLAIGQADGAKGEQGSVFVRWRCPEYDGVNCLYLQLRLLGYTGTWEEVIAAVPGGAERASLSGLAKAARRLGFPLLPAKLNMAELSTLSSPTVILFEEKEVGRGRFHLLVKLFPSQAHLVDGGFITRGELMPIDRFRRGWTGFALVPRSASPVAGTLARLVLGVVTAVAAVWLARSAARRRQRRARIPHIAIPPFSSEACMITSSFVHRLTLVAAVCITLFEGSALHAQDANLPDSVRARLARFTDLDPLAVTWSEISEETPLAREKIAAKILANGRGRTYDEQLAFRDSRIYLHREIREPSAASFGKKSLTVEAAFDRSVFYFGNPAHDPKNPNKRPFLQKWLPGKDQPEADYFSADYFRAAGIRLPSRVKELVLSWHPQSELLALLSEGGRIEATGPAEMDGHPLIRVRVKALELHAKMPPIDLAALERQLRHTPSLSEKEIQERLQDAHESNAAQPPQRRYDFYFDPQRGYAVRRLDTRDEAGRLLIRSDCTEHEQLEGRVVWLPRRCRLEKYTFVGLPNQVFESPLFVNLLRVSALDLKPWPYDRFELNYTKPGTEVNDATFSEAEGRNGIHYQMPANPQQLDEVIAAARAQHQARGNAGKRIPTIRTILLIINGLGLPILVFYLIVRRRKKASNA